ncbi:MAG: hypothetical protein AAGF12_04250 [Myxococcota bacterium]
MSAPLPVRVASMGGVGTTAILEYLEAEAIAANPPRGVHNPAKHAVTPPAGGVDRALFLVGCPYLSLESLFRRGYDALHYANVAGLLPEELRLTSEDAWQRAVRHFGLREREDGAWVDGAGRFADAVGAIAWARRRGEEREHALRELTAFLTKLRRESYRDLDGYLERGDDLFRWREQHRAWSAPAPYPLRMAHFESVFRQPGPTLQFLGVPEERWSRFPALRSRASTLAGWSAVRKRRAEALYGALAEAIRQFESRA